MYKVLYRKYRPRFFADVVGQPQVTVTLKSELTRGRIAHAYLFTGSRGTGKTTCAKILARAVNCLSPVEGDPCGECEVCRGLEEGSILDVVEIDAASNNGIENIRTLIEESSFTPATGKYRVYIIDEVHMLSVQAFNALLKTLEEPPAHVIFILATTEVHKLLPTILSRCQRFDFHRIDPELIADRLMDVAEREETVLDRDAALLIARIADGALRDALSLLDQCLGRDRHVKLETVQAAAGIADQSYLPRLAQAVAGRDPGAALSIVHRLYEESKDLSRLCQELAEYFRGLMLCKTMRDPQRLLGAEDQKNMESLAGKMSLADILHGLDTLEEALNKMRYSHQRTQLEMALVRLCSPELDTTPEALLRRLEALERAGPVLVAPVDHGEEVARPAAGEDGSDLSSQDDALSVLDDPVEQPPPREPAKPVVSKPPEARPLDVPPPPEPTASKPGGAQPDIEALSAQAQRFRDWPEILQVIRSGAKSVAMAFEGSKAYINGEYMLIDAPDIAFELLKKPEQRKRLREAVQRVTGQVYKLGPYRKASQEGPLADPIDDLMNRAREAGLAVTEEG